MSLLNQIARNCTVSIAYANGTGSLSVTAQLIDLVVGNSHLDESGLIKVTGKLTLAGRRVVGFSEELDPRINRSRWLRGNRITVQIADSTGALVPHPRGALRILKTPPPPSLDGGNLEIEVGCDIAYFDSPGLPESNIDASPTFPAVLTRAIAINYLADKIGAPLLIDSIPEYPLAYLPSDLDGSRIAQMGGLAFVAGYVLWMDGDRALRAARIDVERSPDYTYSAILDASSFEFRPADETTAENVTVVAPMVTRTIFEVDPPRSDTTEEGNYKETVTTSINGDVYFVESRKQLKDLFPTIHPNNRAMAIASTTTRSESYSTEMRLDSEEEMTRSPQGVVLPTLFPGSTTLIDSERTITNYEYQNGATYKISVLSYRPAGVAFPFDPLYPVPTALVLVEMDVKRWDVFRDGYQLTQTKLDLTTRKSEATTDYSPTEYTPPAPKYKKADYDQEETPTAGGAEFEQDGGTNSGLGRSRVYRVTGSISSPQQAVELAKTLGQILYARGYPVSWSTAIPNTMLSSYSPLRVWKWIDPKCTSRYMADGDAFAIAPDEATFAADGLFLGTENTPGVVDPPYRFKLKGTLAIGSSSVFDLSVVEDALLLGTVAIGSSSVFDLSVTASTGMSGVLAIGSSSTFDLSVTEPSVLIGSMASETTSSFVLSVQDFVPGSTRTYVSNNDLNGLFQWLGTLGLTTSRLNPSSPLPVGRALSLVTFSSVDNFGLDVSRMTDRVSSAVTTGNFANSWMQFDISRVGNRTLVCNYYTVRARNDAGDGSIEHPTAFTFQGSNDATAWVDLDVRTGLTYVAATFHSYPVSGSTAYRYFRLIQTALNSSGNNRFALSEFEIYGVFT